MPLTLDNKGYPLLLGTIQVPTESGNPYHNPATGQFSYAPAGVRVLKGDNLLKLLSSSSRKFLADKAKLGKANQLAADFVDGKIHIVLLNNGKRLFSFAVAPSQNKQGDKAVGEGGSAKGGKLQLTPIVKDSIIDAARQLNLEGDALLKFIAERLGTELGPELEQQILELVKQQRIEDLISYLHQQLRVSVDGASQDDSLVKIAVGRGFFRKTFAGLDEATTQIVLQRLQGKGWSEDVLQAQIVGKFPKRLKEVFAIENKKLRGKEQVEKSKSTRAGSQV